MLNRFLGRKSVNNLIIIAKDVLLALFIFSSFSAKKRKSCRQKRSIAIHKCGKCEYSSDCTNKLKRHISTKHENNKIPCTMYNCNYVAKHLDYLKHHNKVVHEGIRYQCDQCTYSGTYAKNLTRHKQCKHGFSKK